MSNMSEIDLEREEGRLLSADFGLSVPAAPAEIEAPPRTVETVTLEIRTLQRQAQQITLSQHCFLPAAEHLRYELIAVVTACSNPE